MAEADEFDRSFLRLTPVRGGGHHDRPRPPRHLPRPRGHPGRLRRTSPAACRSSAASSSASTTRTCSSILPRLADRRHRRPTASRRRPTCAAVDARAATGRHAASPCAARQRRRSLGEIELPLPGPPQRAQRARRGRRRRWRCGSTSTPIARGHRRASAACTAASSAWAAGAAPTVVDDYAHHPTEVAATLEAARQAFPRGRVLHAVFQPHLFSRTRDQAEDFGRALLRRRPRGRDRRLPVARGADPGRHRRAGGRGGAASGHRNVALLRRLARRAGAACARRCARATWSLTLGAGDVYRLAQQLAGGGRRSA